MELDACSAESLQFDYEEDESAATSLNEEECDDLEEFLSNTLTDCNLSDASVEDGYDVEEESVASNYVAKEYNDGDVEDSPLPEDIYQVLAEKDGLLKRLRDKLKNEKEKGAKSNEVNKNLQSEYERVLQRLAQCELHIDRLRLSSSNDHVVNKKLKVIYEVEKPVVQAVDPSHPFAQLHTPEPVASSSSPVRALSPSGSGLSDPFVSSHLSSDVLIPVAVGQNEGNAPLEERLPLTMPVQSSVSKEGITDSYPPGVRHDYCHGDTEQLKEAESPTLPQGSRGGRQQWLVPPSNSYTHHEGDTSDSSLQLSRVSSSASQKRKRQKKKITYSSSPEHLSSSRSSDQNCDNLLSALASLEAQQSAVTQKLNLQNGNRSGSEGLDKELESQIGDLTQKMLAIKEMVNDSLQHTQNGDQVTKDGVHGSGPLHLRSDDHNWRPLSSPQSNHIHDNYQCDFDSNISSFSSVSSPGSHSMDETNLEYRRNVGPSGPRQNRGDVPSDLSGPRQNRGDVPSDLSGPRQNRGDVPSDLSGPRQNRGDVPSDLSGPRQNRGDVPSDLSGPRQNRGDVPSDLSGPRQNRGDVPSDLSGPRQNRGDVPSDLSGLSLTPSLNEGVLENSVTSASVQGKKWPRSSSGRSSKELKRTESGRETNSATPSYQTRETRLPLPRATLHKPHSLVNREVLTSLSLPSYDEEFQPRPSRIPIRTSKLHVNQSKTAHSPSAFLSTVQERDSGFAGSEEGLPHTRFGSGNSGISRPIVSQSLEEDSSPADLLPSPPTSRELRTECADTESAELKAVKEQMSRLQEELNHLRMAKESRTLHQPTLTESCNSSLNGDCSGSPIVVGRLHVPMESSRGTHNEDTLSNCSPKSSRASRRQKIHPPSGRVPDDILKPEPLTSPVSQFRQHVYPQESQEVSQASLHQSDHPKHSHQSDLPKHSHQSDLPKHSHQSDHSKQSHQSDRPKHSHQSDHPKQSHQSDHPKQSHQSDHPKQSHQSDHPKQSHQSDLPKHNHQSDLPKHSHQSDHPKQSHQSDHPRHSHLSDGSCSQFDISQFVPLVSVHSEQADPNFQWKVKTVTRKLPGGINIGIDAIPSLILDDREACVQPLVKSESESKLNGKQWKSASTGIKSTQHPRTPDTFPAGTCTSTTHSQTEKWVSEPYYQKPTTSATEFATGSQMHFATPTTSKRGCVSTASQTIPFEQPHSIPGHAHFVKFAESKASDDSHFSRRQKEVDPPLSPEQTDVTIPHPSPKYTSTPKIKNHQTDQFTETSHPPRYTDHCYQRLHQRDLDDETYSSCCSYSSCEDSVQSKGRQKVPSELPDEYTRWQRKRSSKKHHHHRHHSHPVNPAPMHHADMYSHYPPGHILPSSRHAHPSRELTPYGHHSAHYHKEHPQPPPPLYSHYPKEHARQASVSSSHVSEYSHFEGAGSSRINVFAKAAYITPGQLHVERKSTQFNPHKRRSSWNQKEESKLNKALKLAENMKKKSKNLEWDLTMDLTRLEDASKLW